MSFLRIWLRSLLSASACAPLALLPVPVMAQPLSSNEPGPAAQVRPALWKVADEDTTIWLFGTIHVLPEDVRWYTGSVSAAFDEADELVTEIPIDSTAETQGVIARRSMRSDGRNLRETLPPALRTEYEAAMVAAGIAPAAFDANDTWLAALMLTLIPLRNAGYNTESGIDAQVESRARARHMRNHAFETAEYQIGLFDELPEETQRSYLAEVIAQLPTVRADIDAMVQAWKSGDAEHLAALLNEDESDAHMRRVLITDRNVAWARWLKERLDRPGTVFVAVGAGHLAGAGSVQDQLAASGITSTRVQ